jgi:hypothetical protein
MKLIYLCSPYTHPDPAVRQARFEAVLDAQAKLMREGNAVYSPIGSCHPVQVRHDLPCEWEYWKEFDELIISRSDELHVLMLDGWKESVGVTAEIFIAEKMGKPVHYVEVSG